jgi:hypothetical protein
LRKQRSPAVAVEGPSRRVETTQTCYGNGWSRTRIKYSQISAQFKKVFAARIASPLSPYFDPILAQVSP